MTPPTRCARSPQGGIGASGGRAGGTPPARFAAPPTGERQCPKGGGRGGGAPRRSARTPREGVGALGRPAGTMTAPVTMYTTAVCPYCIQAERLLRAKGVAEITKIRVDLDPALRRTMMEKTGRRTVPQIYIGDQHVGGYDDLVVLDRAGELDPMLAG